MTNLKKYWVKHPIQLRVAALIALATFPLWIAYCVIKDNWSDVRDALRAVIGLLINGDAP